MGALQSRLTIYIGGLDKNTHPPATWVIFWDMWVHKNVQSLKFLNPISFEICYRWRYKSTFWYCFLIYQINAILHRAVVSKLVLQTIITLMTSILTEYPLPVALCQTKLNIYTWYDFISCCLLDNFSFLLYKCRQKNIDYFCLPFSLTILVDFCWRSFYLSEIAGKSKKEKKG